MYLNPPYTIASGTTSAKFQFAMFVSSLATLLAMLYLVLLYRLKLRALRLQKGKAATSPYPRGLRGVLQRKVDGSFAIAYLKRTETRRLQAQLSFLTGRFAPQAYYWQVRCRAPSHARVDRTHRAAEPPCQFIIWARSAGLILDAYLPFAIDADTADTDATGPSSPPLVWASVLLHLCFALAILAASFYATVRLRPYVYRFQVTLSKRPSDLARWR